MSVSHSCFIHSTTDGHLGCFLILAIANNAAVNTGVLIFFQISVSGFFRHTPRSGIIGSKGRSILNVLRSLHTAFHSGCTSLHSNQQCKKVPLSSYPYHHSFSVDLLIIAILTGMRWYLIVVLICISLISDVEHLFFFFFFLFSYNCLNFLSIPPPHPSQYVYWPSVCPLWRSVYSEF